MAERERTHYETLDVPRNASAQAVKLAFRRLALKYHPDRSGTQATVERFLEITRAYEVLSDPGRRADYDRLLAAREELERKRQAQTPPKASASRQGAEAAQSDKAKRKAVALDVARLVNLYARGRYAEAEKLAAAVIEADSRQPVAYAVLGDIVRARGDFHRAAKLYAFAAQMDPSNHTYLRKHEELLQAIAARPTAVYVATQSEQASARVAPFVGFAMAVLAFAYVALSREPPLRLGLSVISTWTLGLVAMLFLSGVSVGASLSLGDALDRFSTFTESQGARLSPSVALAFVAAVNFWAAAVLYVQAGLMKGSFQLSVTRLFLSIAAVVGLASLGALLSGRIDASQVFLWGGNVAYLGSLCGWMVADALKR